MIPVHKPQRRIFVPVAPLRWVFVLTPKVASNAILDALTRHCGIAPARTWEERGVLPALTLSEVKVSVPDWPRAMFVRNPFDRLVGTYEFHIRQMKLQMSWTLRELGFRADMTFAEFLDRALRDPEADEHLSLQCWQSDRVDFLGRFETMAADWTSLGMALPTLDRVNGTKQRTFAPYYTTETRQRVEHVYAPDLEAYGYLFG